MKLVFNKIYRFYTFLLNSLVFWEMPKRYKNKIIFKDSVIWIDCLHSRSLNIDYQLREILDHNFYNFEIHNLDTNAVMRLIESYLILYTGGDKPFFIINFKLQKYSEYKSEKRDKILDKLLK
jgi:hypothetical protein